MLTKTDLLQFKKIVREEIEAEAKSLQEDLRGEIKLARIEIQKDIRDLKGRIKNLEITTNKIQVERLEEHLNLPSNL